MAIEWHGLTSTAPRGYTCGYCGKEVGSNLAFYSLGSRNFIYICAFCKKPTYFDDLENRQVPGAAFGRPVEHLPHEIEVLYNEARQSCTVSSYTSAVLTCRKLLMHIAVSKGAQEGKSFQYYVDHLAEKGYVPPDGKDWVDHIRERGNEANHEIKIMALDDAQSLIQFLEMLLKFVYEFPKKVPRRAGVTNVKA